MDSLQSAFLNQRPLNTEEAGQDGGRDRNPEVCDDSSTRNERSNLDIRRRVALWLRVFLRRLPDWCLGEGVSLQL